MTRAINTRTTVRIPQLIPPRFSFSTSHNDESESNKPLEECCRLYPSICPASLASIKNIINFSKERIVNSLKSSDLNIVMNEIDRIRRDVTPSIKFTDGNIFHVLQCLNSIPETRELVSSIYTKFFLAENGKPLALEALQNTHEASKQEFSSETEKNKKNSVLFLRVLQDNFKTFYIPFKTQNLTATEEGSTELPEDNEKISLVSDESEKELYLKIGGNIQITIDYLYNILCPLKYKTNHFIVKLEQSNNNNVKLAQFKSLIDLVDEIKNSTFGKDIYLNLLDTTSDVELKKLFDTFFTHTVHKFERDEFPIIIQFLENNVYNTPSTNNISEQNNPDHTKEIAKVYNLICLLEKRCKSINNQVSINPEVAIALEQAKKYITDFYNLDKKTGTLSKKTTTEFRITIESKMKDLQKLFRLEKGTSCSQELFESIGGFAALSLPAVFNNLGSFSENVTEYLAPNSIDSSFSSHSIQAEIKDGYETVNSFLAAAALANSKRLAIGATAKIELQKRHICKTLHIALTAFAYVAEEEKGNQTFAHVQMPANKRREVLAENFSSYFLKKVDKYHTQIERFALVRWAKKLWRWLTNNKMNAPSALPKHIIVHIDAVLIFRNILNRNITDYSEVFEELKQLKKDFIERLGDDGEKLYNEAINNLVFKESGVRGTFFLHLIHKINLDCHKIDNTPKETTYWNPKKIIFDEQTFQKHIDKLFEKWELPTKAAEQKDMNFDEAFVYTHNVILNTKWEDRVTSILAFNELYFKILHSKMLTKQEQKYIFSYINHEINLEEDGHMAASRSKREKSTEDGITSLIIYHSRVLKRHTVVADSLLKGTNGSLDTGIATPVGTEIAALAGPLFDYTKTGNTLHHISLKSYTNIALKYLSVSILKEIEEPGDGVMGNLLPNPENFIEKFADAIYKIETIPFTDGKFRDKKNLLTLNDNVCTIDGRMVTLQKAIEEFRKRKILHAILEADHGQGALLFHLLSNEKFSLEAIEFILKNYFIESDFNQSVNAQLNTKATGDSESIYLSQEELNKFEQFCLFIKNEMQNINTPLKIIFFFVKSMSVLNEMKDQCRTAEDVAIYQRCLNKFVKMFKTCYEDISSELRLISKRPKLQILARQSLLRAVGAFPWAVLNGIAQGTKAISTVGLMASGPSTLHGGIGAGVLASASGLRLLSYTLSDRVNYTENTKNYQFVQTSITNILGVKSVQENVIINYKFSEKLERVNNILTTSTFDTVYSQENHTDGIGNFTKLGWQRITRELFGDYDIDQLKIERINSSFKFLAFEEGVKLIEKICRTILLAAPDKETRLESNFRIIRIICECEFNPEYKINFLIKLFKQIYSGEEGQAILQLETSFMRVKNGGINSFLSGASASAATIGSSILHLTPLPEYVVSAGGDIPQAYGLLYASQSFKGRTKSYQQILKLIKNVLISTAYKFKKDIDPLKFKKIDKLLTQSVLNMNVGRINALRGSNTNSYNKYRKLVPESSVGC